MSLFKLFLALSSFSILTACADKKEEVPLQPTVDTQSVGPFSVNFSQEEIFQKKFSATISQNEGKVEFYVDSDLPIQVGIKETKLEVSGCPASQVKFNMLWIPNREQTPTQGYTVDLNYPLQVFSKSKSTLVAQFQNLESCTHLDFDLTLVRLPFPQVTKGSWISNTVTSTDPYHVMVLDISQFSKSVEGDFRISCDYENKEKFTTEMIYNNESELPRRMIFKIKSIDQVSTQACSKQFGLKATDQGRLIYCIHNKSAQGSVFNLACRLATGTLTYPSDYNDVSTSWQKNY